MSEQAVINEITEVAETVVPEVVETITTVKNNPVLLAGVALVAASAGAGLGYFVAMKRLEPKYKAIADEEIEQAKKYYSILHKDGKFSTPKEAAEQLGTPSPEKVEADKALESYSQESTEIVEDDDEVRITTKKVEVDEDDNEIEEVKEVTSNIFVNGKPMNEDFDYYTELQNRTDDAPYVITEEEFFENESNFSQTSLTYYEGDDVLADEEDKVINEADDLVGSENFSKFGYGSNDRNMLYVRNVPLNAEYEIAKSRGKYTVEVLGLDDDRNEIRHSHRRFRGDDD